MDSEEEFKQNFDKTNQTVQEYLDKNFTEEEQIEFINYFSEICDLIKKQHDENKNKPTS